MFSGIVEELAEVKNIIRQGRNCLLSIKANTILDGLRIGDSVMVNGVCLTVVKISKDSLGFELLSETFKATNLGKIRISDRVNLERSLRVGDRISGHFVTGHIDCVGVVRNRFFLRDNLCFEVAIPQEFMKFIVTKGSVSIDGISLTVVDKRSNIFRVFIIPHTLRNTTLSFKGPSALVNIEFDILQKYQNK